MFLILDGLKYDSFLFPVHIHVKVSCVSKIYKIVDRNSPASLYMFLRRFRLYINLNIGNKKLMEE